MTPVSTMPRAFLHTTLYRWRQSFWRLCSPWLAAGATSLLLSACGAGDSADAGAGPKDAVQAVTDATRAAQAQAIPSHPDLPDASSRADADPSHTGPDRHGLAGNGNDKLWQGAAATVFVDRLDNDEDLSSIRVCADGYVNGIALTTTKRSFAPHGQMTGTCSDNALAAGEQIIRVEGRAGSIIDQIVFLTSTGRTIGPFGGNGGNIFSMGVGGGANGHFGGFSGFATSALQQLNLLDDSAGGSGGVAFIDRLKADQRVAAITICYRSDGYVQSVQLRTNLGVLPQHGASWPELSCNTTTFDDGEYITELFGTADAYVNSLGFKTSKQVYGPFGGPGGEGFSQSISVGAGFRGIYGRSDGWLHRIGLLTAPQGDLNANLFADQLPIGETIGQIEVCAGQALGKTAIRSLQAFYADGNKHLPLHGGAKNANSVCTRIDFAPGEFITELSGRYSRAIDSLSLRTNQGRALGPYGDAASTGAPYLVRNPVTDAFLGFAGNATYTTNDDGGAIHAIDAAAPDVFEAVTAPPANAAQTGWWGSAMNWPLIGIHAVVLPDGRVMSYGSDASGTQGAQFIYDVWNPALGGGDSSHLTLDNSTRTDIFCGSQSLMPSGMVFIAGGDNRQQPGGYNKGIADTTVFDPTSNSLRSGIRMNAARWYASQVILPSGRLLVMGGKDGNSRDVANPEVRSLDGTWKTLTGVTLKGYYPRAFVSSTTTPGVEQVYVISTDGSGKIYRLNVDGASGEGELITTTARLPGLHSWNRPTAQIAPNTVLVALDNGGSSTVVFPSVEGAQPVVADAGALSQVRIWANFVVLPTGEVLAIQGSAGDNKLDRVAYHGELWNPQSRSWRSVASELRPRLYHSAATLLADGRVLSLGGGAPGPVVGTNAQAYSPPYLFSATGTAARPVITLAPTTLAYGDAHVEGADTLSVIRSSDVARVTLVRLASVTHSFDSEQRFIELAFDVVNANQLFLHRPANTSIAPPGYYLLTVINKAGVPSVSKGVRLSTN